MSNYVFVVDSDRNVFSASAPKQKTQGWKTEDFVSEADMPDCQS